MDSARTSSANAASKQQLKSGTSGKMLDSTRKQAASPVDGQNRKQQPPPKAWQGVNPITRANSTTTNGTNKELPKLPPHAQQAKSTELHADKHAHDRLLYIVAHFTGQDATLTLKNGEQFTGIFSGGTLDSSSKNTYLLKMVKRTRGPSQQQANGTSELPDEYTGEGENYAMSFDVQDTVDLAVTNVVTTTARPSQNGSISSSFRTDDQIATRHGPATRERELQRWDAGPTDSSIDMSLEAGGQTGWDQFAANERMYGVQSDYDESIYTTALNRDRSDPAWKRREAEAARIAREIEGSSTTDAHVAEERRVNAEQGEGLDEEEKYSGVRREIPASQLPKRGAGSYVPPSQRAITGAPTVPGAPYDPAIISSSLAKPASSSAANKAATTVPIEHAVARGDQRKPSNAAIAAAGDVTSEPLAQQTPKKAAEQTTDDHMRKVADAFKEFSSGEKLKIKQAQQQKRETVKQEKNIRLNDLKKFAASFKLNSKVPDDLVPILAKDREKQLDIQRKADEAAKDHLKKVAEQKKSGSSTTGSPAKPNTSVKADDAAAAASPAEQRMAAFNQHNMLSRNKLAQLRGQFGQPPAPRGQMQPRGPGPMFGTRNGIAPQPLPADLRIPSGPSVAGPPSADRGLLSPGSTTSSLNVKAFEFRPAANAFMPSGTSPSPQRGPGAADRRKSSAVDASFFGKNKKPIAIKDRKDIENDFNPIKRMMNEGHLEEHKHAIAANGGIPKPWFTPPTWSFPTENAHVSYKDAFPKAQPVSSSQGPSPMHTPNPSGVPGPMPHAQQMPMHLHAPQMGTPNHRPQFHAQPGPYGQPHFAQQMPPYGPNGSVQSSPRFPPAQMAAFNSQVPVPGMPQFAGQPMPGYGMSPGMSYRQPQMPMGPGGPMMMPPHQQQMPHMRPGFPQGPHMMPQMMGGQMMMPNPPSGGYPNGPGMPPQHYSPMPPHAQPAGNYQHMQPGPGGYASSPRPHMMQPSGSHQGFQPPMPGHMQGPQYLPNPGPGQGHPMHFQRQMSNQGGYPQMTPRQQHAQITPQHASPGMAQGDEGK